MAYTMIPRISEEKMAQEKAKTAILLPNNPSERGLTPAQIKQTLAHPLIASFNEINILIDLLNSILSEMDINLNSLSKSLSEHKETYEETVNTLSETIKSLKNNSHGHANLELLQGYTVDNSDIVRAVELVNLLENASMLSTYSNTDEDISKAIEMINEHHYQGLGKTLAIIGDNLKPKDANYNDFWQILANKMKFDNFDYYGEDGNTLVPVDNEEEISPTLLEKTSTIKGDVIVVFGGLFDSINNSEIGNIDDTSESTFCGVLNTLITNLITNNPTSRIIFVTPIQPYAYQTEAYRDAIISICLKHSIPVIDAYALSGIDISLGQVGTEYNAELSIQKLSDDGIHLNQAGHELLADRLSTFVEKLI